MEPVEDLPDELGDAHWAAAMLAAGLRWHGEREDEKYALIADYLERPDEYKARGVDLDAWPPLDEERRLRAQTMARLKKSGWI